MQNETTVKSKKGAELSFSYRPEPVTSGVVDWVTFQGPDILVIERNLPDGEKISCKTKIPISEGRGNSWSVKDILAVVEKKSIEEALQSQKKVQLKTTLDHEGSRQDFIFKMMDKKITISPPDKKDNATDTKDFAELVYVLSKVYKQQINRDPCKSIL